jgi:hypothetical protein
VLPYCRHLDAVNAAAWQAVTARALDNGLWYLSIAEALAASIPPAPDPTGLPWQATSATAGDHAGRPVTGQEAGRIAAACSNIPGAPGDVTGPA